MSIDSAIQLCPVCGFELADKPWDDGPSDEICPSCGIHFGFDDFAGGNAKLRQEVYRLWRERWLLGGPKWWSGSRPAPTGWDPHAQLAKLTAT